MKKEKTRIQLAEIKSHACIFTEDEKEALIIDTAIKIVQKKASDNLTATGLLLDIDPILKDEKLAEELYGRLMAANDIILFLTEHLIVTAEDIVPVGLIRQVAPEIERLYMAINMRAYSMNKSISQLSEDDVKKAVKAEYRNNVGAYQFLKEKHFHISYELIGGQERRSFFGRILHEYLEDKKMKFYGEEKAYKLYKIINGLHNHGGIN